MKKKKKIGPNGIKKLEAESKTSNVTVSNSEVQYIIMDSILSLNVI